MADTAIERHYRFVLRAMDELLRAGQHLRMPAPRGSGDERYEIAYLRAREVYDAALRQDPELVDHPGLPLPSPKLTMIDWHMVAGDALQIGDLDRAISIINANYKGLNALSIDDLRGCYIALGEAVDRAQDIEAIERIEMGIDKWLDLRLRFGELLARAEGAAS